MQLLYIMNSSPTYRAKAEPPSAIQHKNSI